jgi:hypothetical protein
MVVELSRLRRGEIIAAASAVVLLAAMFLTSWFRFGHTDADGWTGLPLLRWLLVVSGVLGLLIASLQASRRAPAVPVAMDVVTTVWAALTTLALIVRLPTSDGRPQVGAFLGLVAVAGITTGAFMALRREDGWRPDAEHPIEQIAVGPPGRP